MLTNAELVALIRDKYRAQRAREMASNILIGRLGVVAAMELVGSF